MHRYSLYHLIDPTTDAVRYVGITRVPLKSRLARHCRPGAFKSNPHKFRWIASLKKQNKKPTIKLIADSLTVEAACKLEIEHIAELANLTNIALGGNVPPSAKGRKLSEEAKQAIGKRSRKFRHTEEAKKRISMARRKAELARTPSR